MHLYVFFLHKGVNMMLMLTALILRRQKNLLLERMRHDVMLCIFIIVAKSFYHVRFLKMRGFSSAFDSLKWCQKQIRLGFSFQRNELPQSQSSFNMFVIYCEHELRKHLCQRRISLSNSHDRGAIMANWEWDYHKLRNIEYSKEFFR